MMTWMLRAKLHRARVTGADIHYTGSITIDQKLLEEVGMFPYERVLVVDVENGARLETYIIPGAPGSGEVQINGAAARLVSVGDHIIVMAFALTPLPPPQDWSPRVAVLDEQNRIAAIQGEGGTPCC